MIVLVYRNLDPVPLWHRRKAKRQRLDRQVADDRTGGKHPRTLLLHHLLKRVIQETVEQRISYRGQQPDEQ